MADKIKCPYCEYVEEWENHPDFPEDISNGGECEFECSICEKKFMVTMDIEWSTNKYCQLNNEEHVWEKKLEGYSTLFCKNCEAVKRI